MINYYEVVQKKQKKLIIIIKIITLNIRLKTK